MAQQSETTSAAHWVHARPDGSASTEVEVVPVAEPSLIDAILIDHRHAITLFTKLLVACVQGNTHAMELLAAALAVDVRLHAQATLDVLCPLLERRCGGEGAQQAQRIRQELQAVERDVLELLTFRREQDWPELARRADLTHKDFAGHAYDVEVGVLPRLAADMRQDELVSSGLLFQQQKQTASLAPQLGDQAWAAAAAVGPDHASVLGGPLLAGQYQPHSHHHLDPARLSEEQAARAAADLAGLQPQAGAEFPPEEAKELAAPLEEEKALMDM